MARKKGRAKKKNPKLVDEEKTDLVKAPHSFVIHRGLPCPYIQDLTKDFRRIMEPFTAANLREKKSNRIKDFVSLSGHFNVSHMCIFNKTSTQLSFKVARLPRGPTLTFRIHQFTLARDIISASRKQFVDEECFHSAPLVVMNNFTDEGKHLKLMTSTFQNMFPTINLPTVKLSTIKRCLLFSYNPTTKLIEMRHYTIMVVPVGLSRGVKKVVLGKIPNLSKCDDIADLITHGGAVSDSEFEDDEANQVIVPQNLKRRGNLENNKSAIRLFEIGPRLTFELIKIEEGLLTGEVLYHDVVVKSEAEVEEIRRRIEKKKKLKEHRKKIQNENKLKKEQQKDGLKKSKRTTNEEEANDEDEVNTNQIEPDDDAAYYKEEVGEEPEDELFSKREKDSRKRVRLPKHMHAKEAKRRKVDPKQGKKENKTGKNWKKNSDDQKKGTKGKPKNFAFKTKSGHNFKTKKKNFRK